MSLGGTDIAGRFDCVPRCSCGTVLVIRAWSSHISESQNPAAIKVMVRPEGPPEFCCHPTLPPPPPWHVTPFKPAWDCDISVAKHLFQHPQESWSQEEDGGEGEGARKFVLI